MYSAEALCRSFADDSVNNALGSLSKRLVAEIVYHKECRNGNTEVTACKELLKALIFNNVKPLGNATASLCILTLAVSLRI